MHAKLVATQEELDAIYALNLQNLKGALSAQEREEQGFVTWLYTPELLQAMHAVAPSMIVKDGETLAGYALATPEECRAFHPDLEAMFENLALLTYKGAPLFSCSFYCMGQICVDKKYRGSGVFAELYAAHKKFYGGRYDMLVTEISTANKRSQRAHEKVGFTTIHTYRDHLDEWNVVVWDWR